MTLKARLTAAGVDTAQLRAGYGASGVAVIMVDAPGRELDPGQPGRQRRVRRADRRRAAVVAGGDVLLCQLEIPVATVTEAARAARAAGTRVMLNAAPARELPPELLDAVDLLVVNEGEAQAITGRGEQDIDALLDAGAPGGAHPRRRGRLVRGPGRPRRAGAAVPGRGGGHHGGRGRVHRRAGGGLGRGPRPGQGAGSAGLSGGVQLVDLGAGGQRRRRAERADAGRAGRARPAHRVDQVAALAPGRPRARR